MDITTQSQLWIQILLIVLQAGIGATSALIAVYLTQRSANQERQQKMFERLFEPHFHAHQEIFLQLIDFQNKLVNNEFQPTPEIKQTTRVFGELLKRHLIWLNEEIANKVLDVIERVTVCINKNERIPPTIQDNMIEIQRKMRDTLGINEFTQLMNKLKNIK